MLVHELIELLQKLPQHYTVVMSKDSEGNDFSPFDGHSLAQYIPRSTWSGEIMTLEWAQEEAGPGNTPHYNENAVILWPVN